MASDNLQTTAHDRFGSNREYEAGDRKREVSEAGHGHRDEYLEPGDVLRLVLGADSYPAG